jgi:outer membrane protein assembly factor BamE (lipoprotein component of BamABCDE complex)
MRKGMSRDEVLQILGKPSFNDALMSKDSDYWGCEWYYVLEGKWEDGTFTITDKLELRFDENDALQTFVRTDQYGHPPKQF